MPSLLLSIIDGMVTFGNKPLFENMNLNIHDNEKICLIGKNGAGKTTLMNLLTGKRELDAGRIVTLPDIKIGYLEQDFEFDKNQTVFDFIFSVLPKDKQNEENKYMVDMMAYPLELDLNSKLGEISGGQLRRAGLARALVEEPQILILDEPTNHVDLQGIEWLEQYLRTYKGSYMVVSHDKRFLENISDKVFWLDRGQIKICPRGFKHFEEWSEMLLDQERRELEKRQKIMGEELEWATKGVKARRKRNVRRVEQIKLARDKLKMDVSNYNRAIRKIEFKGSKDELDFDSKVVAEFYNANKTFKSVDGVEKIILNNFKYKITKGDRIGILGKNGSGKTTFLKMLLKELEPDTGTVKLAKTVEFSYFDQKRQDLKNENTLWETLVPKGGDYVNVMGKLRHVCGYLKNFMFDPKDAKNFVGTLSGGQKNRLMLAKVLANPGSLLILDEPTNDLDMDTLEMLEDILSNYKGTLIVVSHDRDFLDQIVTRILAFEGQGVIEQYIGGYTDYLEEKEKEKRKNYQAQQTSSKSNKVIEIETPESRPKKLSYKEKYEFENLPEKMEMLELEIKELSDYLSNPSSYSESPADFIAKNERIKEAKQELDIAELRWLELSEMVG